MKKPAVTSGGLPGTYSDAADLRVSGTADTAATPRRATVIATGRARGFGLWLRLRHRRRVSKALDRLLLGLPGIDPWSLSVPVGDVFMDGRLGVPEREAAGRELAGVDHG
jgi:hypothetical protein